MFGGGMEEQTFTTKNIRVGSLSVVTRIKVKAIILKDRHYTIDRLHSILLNFNKISDWLINFVGI